VVAMDREQFEFERQLENTVVVGEMICSQRRTFDHLKIMMKVLYTVCHNNRNR